MAKCPCCGNELKVDDTAWAYVDIYSNSAVATTLCCGNFVTISPVRRYKVSATTYHYDTIDDWGVPGNIFKKEN